MSAMKVRSLLVVLAVMAMLLVIGWLPDYEIAQALAFISLLALIVAFVVRRQ